MDTVKADACLKVTAGLNVTSGLSVTGRKRKAGRGKLKISYEADDLVQGGPKPGPAPVTIPAAEHVTSVPLEGLLPWNEPKPFRQGSFDHYCGIYALMNGLHLAIQRTGHCYLDDVDWSGLFSVIVRALIDNGTLPEAILGGITMDQLVDGLIAMSGYLKTHTRFELSFSFPWDAAKRPKKPMIKQALKDFTASPGTAVVLHYRRFGIGHWSALKEVSSAEINFLDSAKARPVPLRKLSTPGTSARRWPEFEINPDNVVILSVTNNDPLYNDPLF